MTQGYGPDHGPHGQSEQWGQASPAVPSAPGAGSSPAAPAAPTALVRWLYYGALAVVIARGLYLLSNLIFSIFVVGLARTVTSADDAVASVGVGMILLLLGLVVVDVVSVALLVLAIMVMVKSSGRTRTGAIVVGAAVLASFLVYLVTRLIFFIAQDGAGSDIDALVTITIVEYVLMGVHWLVFSAVVIIGARLSRNGSALNA